jgi:hypothetical protein
VFILVRVSDVFFFAFAIVVFLITITTYTAIPPQAQAPYINISF